MSGLPQTQRSRKQERASVSVSTAGHRRRGGGGGGGGRGVGARGGSLVDGNVGDGTSKLQMEVCRAGLEC